MVLRSLIVLSFLVSTAQAQTVVPIPAETTTIPIDMVHEIEKGRCTNISGADTAEWRKERQGDPIDRHRILLNFSDVQALQDVLDENFVSDAQVKLFSPFTNDAFGIHRLLDGFNWVESDDWCDLGIGNDLISGNDYDPDHITVPAAGPFVSYSVPVYNDLLEWLNGAELNGWVLRDDQPGVSLTQGDIRTDDWIVESERPAFELLHQTLRGDTFPIGGGNGQWDINDVDILGVSIALGFSPSVFTDWNEDDVLDVPDLNDFLEDVFVTLPGDVDLDGVVGPTDLDQILLNWFQTDKLYSQGDVNADNVVDGRDFNIWNMNKGQTPGGASTITVIPEPASFLSVIVGFFMFCYIATNNRNP